MENIFHDRNVTTETIKSDEVISRVVGSIPSTRPLELIVGHGNKCGNGERRIQRQKTRARWQSTGECSFQSSILAGLFSQTAHVGHLSPRVPPGECKNLERTVGTWTFLNSIHKIDTSARIASFPTQRSCSRSRPFVRGVEVRSETRAEIRNLVSARVSSRVTP